MRLPEAMIRNDLSRRAFLARIGVLGASALLLPSCATPAGPATGTASEALGLDTLIGLLEPILGQLAADTLNGFVAFILPGNDAYSQAQGTPRSEPGGIAAGGTSFLINNFDRFLPLPQELVQPASTALITALKDLPLPLPASVLGLLGGLLGPGNVTLGLVEGAVDAILASNTAAPLSLPVALLLNYVATVVDPVSLVQGPGAPFLSPFARLSFAHKAAALAQIEVAQSNLVALIDAQIPEPAKDSVSGLLKFFGGALYEFAAFGTVGESQLFDPATRTLTGRPVGWQLTGFLPDGNVGDGWDNLIGYYQDRREVSDV
jgi:hypothetical protein